MNASPTPSSRALRLFSEMTGRHWLPGRRALAAVVLAALFLKDSGAQESPTGDWKTNGSSSWGTASNWNNLAEGTSYPSGIDAIANVAHQITATRTITLNVPVTLGTLNIGDVSGGSAYVITGGTLTFDVSTGAAQLNKINDGGNDTISSAIVLNDQLDITVGDPTNNQGLIISGAISGGTAGLPTITFNDVSGDTSLNWLYLSGVNTFEGQIVVESGLLRYEGNDSSSGARGVGNETIVLSGGSVDLRNRDLSINGVDDTEIFILSGFGANGRGALRNTSSTANLNHIIMDDDIMVGGYSTIDFIRHTDSLGNDVAPILEMNGHSFSKIGTNEFRIRNADIRNIGVFNVYEGELKFENDGAMVGGDPGDYLNDLSGTTINVYYNKNPYDGVDPLNGTRSLDPFSGAAVTALNGNTISNARISFATIWGNHTLHSKVTQTHDNFTVNLSNGTWQREGSSSAGQTFDQIFGPNVTINLVAGGVGKDTVGPGNLFDINSGSSAYNSTNDAFDHPGATEIQGVIDNTSPGNEGTGFTARGNRELRITGDNSTSFDGDILIKRPTARWVSNSFTTSGSAPAASEFTNMSLAGADGSFTGANSITLTRWGSLALLNNSANAVYASANNNDRLNDDGSLILRDGFVKIQTDVVVANTENLGHVIADAGTNYLYLDTRAGGQFDGSFQSFTRNDNGVLKIYVTNPAHTFGAGVTDDRVFVHDTSGLTTIGSGAAGTTSAAVVYGIFGTALPTLSTPSIAAYTRSLETVQGSFMYAGAGMSLMTLDNGYLRPLTDAEFATGSTPVAGTNWRVNGYVNPVTGTEGYADRNNYAARNVVSDIAVNSLTITFDAAASGDALTTASKDYVIIETGKTLKIDSGIINLNNFVEANSANQESFIRGGSLDMNGQVALINSNAIWHDLDRNTANWYEVMTGNSSYIRSSITNATGLIKTGRNSLYLDSANEISGNVYVSEQGSIIARHHNALGEGGAGREVRVGGGAAFLLEYGSNITGIDVRVTNTTQSNATVLRNEGTTHSTWGGDVILDVADAYGTSEFQSYYITARNNGTLSLYGNIYTDNNSNLTDSDTYSDPPLVSTSLGETFTLNLRGQVRDIAGGNLANPIDGNPDITSIFRTGDSATRLDSNHSLRFQMSGHDEGNVNVFQQWDATGRLDMRQGYFRVLYDPNEPGNDGFFTQGARDLRLANDYMNRVVIGADGTSTTNAYHAHLMLTRDGQVFNSPYIHAYNDNRNGTLTIGGENESGTVYFGSIDNSVNFSLQYANQSTVRDVRFLQVRGGSLVFNGRLDDEHSTAQSFNASVSIVGPGTVVFNRNAIGNSDIDRWNFMAGEARWGEMTGNNQFASASTNAAVGVSTWGGGGLVLEEQSASRTQTLNSHIWLLNGSSYANTQGNTTLTLGVAAAGFSRASGSSLAFLEDGGSINISAASLSTTAGDFLGSWGVYGSAADGVTDWAARQSTTGVQAFAGYSVDAFGSGLHTNLTTSPGAFGADTSSATVRFENPAEINLGGFNLTLEEGGILVSALNSGAVSINNGTLTSGWSAGGNDLLLHHFGSGVASIGAVITDNAGKVNLVNAGNGTTILSGSNTHTGNTYLNGGVLQISSDANLGQVDASIAKIVRVVVGSNNGASLSGRGLNFTTLNDPLTTATGTYNSNSSQQITSLVLTDGGSGYSSGVHVSTDANNDGTVAGDGNGGIRAIMDSGNLHFDGGTLHVTETMALNAARTIFLGGNGGTLRVDGGETLTIDGYISSEFSHVTTDNGYTLVNHIGTDWQPASDRNPDIGDLILEGGGTVVMRGAPDGTVRGNMFNSYGGITWINEGVLNIASAGTSADGILGTNRSWVDGTVIGPQGTLLLSTTSDATIREWFTFRGQGYEGGGTIRTTGTARTYRFAGQLFLEDDVLINSKNASGVRFNESGGTMYGSADIIKLGSSSLYFYGNSPDWTGSVVNASHTLYFGSAGNLGGMESLTLNRNTLMYLLTGSTTYNEFRDRLPDALPIYTNGYVRLRQDATGGVYSGVEKVGTATVVGGQLGLEFNLGSDLVGGVPRLTGDYGVLHFDAIVRSVGTTVHFRSLDAGTEFAGADFLTTQFENVAGVRVETLPGISGSGDGGAGDAAIVLGFFGGVRPAWFNAAGTGNIYSEDFTSTRLVTASTTAGGQHYLRPLLDSEYVTVGSPDDAQTTTVSLADFDLTSDHNLRIVGVNTDTGIGAGELTNRRNSILTLGGEKNLALNSITFESESFVNGAASGRGNYTGINMAEDETITIHSGTIVVANRGVQNRNGVAHSTSINLDLRSSINGGSLDFTSREAIFNIAGRWVHYNTADAADAYREVDADSTYLFLNSAIKNATDLIKTGGGSLMLQTANDYNGNTYIDQGLLYARHDRALGNGTHVYVSGAGGLIASHGVHITGKTIEIGMINGNNLGLALQEGASWGGEIIIDNVDSAGGSSYNRTFTPRIYQDTSFRSSIHGNIYSGTSEIGGAGITDSRMFSTYDTSNGILDLRGMVRDTAAGAVSGPITTANQNQVLRMELVSNNSENTVQFWNAHDAAGRIRLIQANLVFQGNGNFYSDEAAAAIESAIGNAMVGFQMGGRSVMSSDGSANDDLSFFLANSGSLFNLSSWEVGVDSTDEENSSGADNFNRGNVSGNSTMGGLNTSGSVTFGTGAGVILFNNMTRFDAYNRDLRLHAALGGTVNINAALIDGGEGVASSITKVGGGTVNLNGSSIGDSTLEGVNVLGGMLVLTNYDVNANRRVGQGADVLLGGGMLVMDGGDASFTENLGGLTLRSGGSALVAVGNGVSNFGTLHLSASSITRATGGTLHFQSIAGGMIGFTDAAMASVTRIGSYATYGANVALEGFATDWAATDAVGNLTAFTGYGVDAFGAATHTDVATALQLSAGTSTASVRFNDSAGSIADDGSGPFTLTLEDGGVLITSNYASGTPFSSGVTLTTAAAGTELIVHNFATGAVAFDASITGAQNVVFTGSGSLTLGGTSDYTGATYVNGQAVVAFDDPARFGGTSAFHLNGGTLEYNAVATTAPVITQSVILGGASGVIRVLDADSRLIFRGNATNQFTGEANPLSSITSGNPFSGGLTILGEGTVQFGRRSLDGTAETATANNVTDVLGVNNNYTGLTIIGDGVNAVRVDIQGQANDNAQYTPFGTTYSWADGTIVRNNATIEFSSKRGDGSRDGQYRFQEWFQIGEQAGDQVTFAMTTYRQATLDGHINVIGDWTLHSENAAYLDAGNTTTNTDILINPNAGGIYGAGDIIKTGNGNIRFYQNLREWTGDLHIHDGFVGLQSYQTSMLNTDGVIYFGDPNAVETSLTRLRVEPRYGNNTISLDSGFQTIEIARDIIVLDGLRQEVRVELGYSPETFLTFSGNLHVGDNSNYTTDSGLRQFVIYQEDTTGLSGEIVGHYQHSVMAFTGDITGSNNIMLYAHEGGSTNDTIDDSDILLTVLISGDNSAFTGRWTIGLDAGVVLDMDDAQILRLGSVNALNDNLVAFRNRGTLQLGGIDKTFTQNFLYIGGAGTHTSAGIENASDTATTVTFDSGAQAGPVFQDIGVGLRDGVAQPVFGGGTAALNVVKIGVGETVFGAATGGNDVIDAFSSYTGTTQVQDGTLISGTNNSLSPYSRFIVSDGATLSLYWDNAGVGFDNTIGSLSGTSGAATNIDSSILRVGGDHSNGADFAGVVSGFGDLFKIGGGSQQLSGDNTFSGNLGVVQGALIGGSNTAFGDEFNSIGLGGVTFVTLNPIDARVELLLAGTATAVNNAVLMNSFDGNDEGITIIGTRQDTGTYGFGESGTIDAYQNFFAVADGSSVFSFGGEISNQGALTKIGLGTVELRTANYYGPFAAADLAIDGGTVIRHGTLALHDADALSSTVVELGDVRRSLGAVQLATTASLLGKSGASYDAAGNGADGAGAGAFLKVGNVIDGVTLSAADAGTRILVKDEHDTPEWNGIYEVVSVNETSGHMTLTRVADFDESSEMLYGSSVAVTAGTQGGMEFFMASRDIGSVNAEDTDPVHWERDHANPDVSLLIAASEMTIFNDIDINDTNGTGSTTVGGSFETGTATFAGNITLQNQTLPGVDNVRELTVTSASNDDAGGGERGVIFSGMITEGTFGDVLSVDKQGAGTVTFTNLNSYTGKTTVSAGTLALAGGGEISATSWIEVADGATFDFAEASAGDLVFDGPVSGSGTFVTGSNSLVIGTEGGAGVLRPGMSSGPSDSGTAGAGIGILTVQGNLVLAGDATGADRLTLQMGATGGADYNDAANFSAQMAAGTFATWIGTQGDFYDTHKGGNHDRVVVTGEFTMNSGGLIRFTNNGGADYAPELGDVFNLLDWSSANPNSFDVGGSGFRDGGLLGDLELPSLGSMGLLYDTSLFFSHGIVVVVPEPGRAALVLLGLAVVLLRRRREMLN